MRVEDRWILSKLQRTIASVTEKLESYDFAHAAQEAYSFVFRDLCDWYLEIVKPRLYDGEEEAAATLLYALERVLALLHPLMPFVTEEIWSYHPARDGHLAVHAFPAADPSLRDEAAEADVEAGIQLTQRLRAWRDLAGVPVAATLPALIDGVEPPGFVGRLSRFAFDNTPARLHSGREESDMDAPSIPPRGGAEPVASVGPVRVLASEQLDAEAVAARLRKRREELESEVERASRKLENEGFVSKAPAEVVEEERGKLERYRQELAELA